MGMCPILSSNERRLASSFLLRKFLAASRIVSTSLKTSCPHCEIMTSPSKFPSNLTSRRKRLLVCVIFIILHFCVWVFRFRCYVETTIDGFQLLLINALFLRNIFISPAHFCSSEPSLPSTILFTGIPNTPSAFLTLLTANLIVGKGGNERRILIMDESR